MKRKMILLFCAVLLVATAGESATKKKKPSQYKKYPRDQVTHIAQGQAAKAKSYWENYLEKHPDDLESHYGLAICYAQEGLLDKAMTMARQGVDKGLPFGRFLAGPRGLLKPLTDSAAFETWAREQGVELIHGPTLGCLTDRGVRCWVRTRREVPVEIHVSESKDFGKAIRANGHTKKSKDFTCTLDVSGLKSSTDYIYRLVVDGKLFPEVYDFKTMPTEGKPAEFTVMFGGGAGYTPWLERMWNTIDAHRPRAYMALGDNVYIDTPTVRATQQYCYYRRQSRPEFRNFVSSTAVYAIWDDHDFTTNDGSGGPEIDVPSWKRDVWKTFQNNYVNPAYGGGDANPGCWFTCSMADVDFFLIDGRYYRSHKHKSMLGPVQKKQLLSGLKNSKATFKVLCTNVPITPGVKPGSKDTWDGFSEEREEIFRFVEKNRIEGFFVISADRHRSDAYRNDRSKGYPIYEFQSSKLTNVHTHKLIDKCLFGYNEKCSFGLLKFNTRAEDPRVTYDVINIDNEKIHSLTLRLSELQF